MKAKLLAGCPDALLVDITHSVPAFDVFTGGFLLWAGTRDFPPGAVHLAVVDPGVGGSRRPVALRLDGSWYVGPDNGLFGVVLKKARSHPSGIELSRPASASATFEGRDVFAPAAAALAAGRPPGSLGSELEGEPAQLPARPPSVLWVDNFGNLITSLEPPIAGLRLNAQEVRMAARTYSEAPPQTPFFYLGSMGLIEVGVREARADERLEAGPGTEVQPL